MPAEDGRIVASEPRENERNRRLAELYQEHADGLRDLLLGLLRDRAEADEALQQVFLQLLKSWDTVQPECVSPIKVRRRSRNCRRVERRTKRMSKGARIFTNLH